LSFALGEHLIHLTLEAATDKTLARPARQFLEA
jgi:hypothetical protein